MQFDLVSPERRLASVEATSVLIPGAEGDMTVMANHAATVTTLRPGLVTVTGGDTAGEFIVTGGFAEIGAEGTSILAEKAVPRAEANAELLQELMEEAQKAAEIATEDAKAAARMRINDVSELMKLVG